MSYFDQMIRSSGMFSPQSMNYAGQQAAQSSASDDGFWSKLQGWFEQPGGAAAMSPFLDHMLAVGQTPPQFHYPGVAQGSAMPNPGAQTLGSLLQAITYGGR